MVSARRLSHLGTKIMTPGFRNITNRLLNNSNFQETPLLVANFHCRSQATQDVIKVSPSYPSSPGTPGHVFPKAKPYETRTPRRTDTSLRIWARRTPLGDLRTILPDFHPVSVIEMFNALEQERTQPYPMLEFFFSTAYSVEGIVGERHGFDLGVDFLAGMKFEGG